MRTARIVPRRARQNQYFNDNSKSVAVHVKIDAQSLKTSGIHGSARLFDGMVDDKDIDHVMNHLPNDAAKSSETMRDDNKRFAS